MSKQVFSPVPWEVEHQIDEDGDHIWWVNATVMCFDPYNAQFISAAPDMYEALKAIIDSGDIPYCYTDKLVIKAKQAITKAEGGTP